MQGNILYPLNTLKDAHPEVYTKAASKYEGREQIMKLRIPSLDCLWNDVLHFSAVHPSEIKKALAEAGRVKPLGASYFEIDPHLLDPKDTIVYLNRLDRMADKFNKDNVAAYNPDEIAQYAIMPQETKDYYTDTISQGKEPLVFHVVPHILFKGCLDTSKFNKISL